VLVDLLTSPAEYDIYLVDTSGCVVTHVRANRPRHAASQQGTPVDLPFVSASATRLYYMDGNSDLRTLLPDGRTESVLKLGPPENSEATFAVSADDQRVASARIDFDTSPPRVDLYSGSFLAQHLIFSSTTDYVWPVAWHGADLVLAHASGPYRESPGAPGQINPYWAISYHIVDPNTADQHLKLGNCTGSGPLGPAGTACIQGAVLDWHGNMRGAGNLDFGGVSSYASLSPDGTLVAATKRDSGLSIWTVDTGANVSTPVTAKGYYWAGWLDQGHLLTGSATDAGFQPQLLNLETNTVVNVPAHGFYAATLPTDVS
jgi:WD40 repeat protein